MTDDVSENGRFSDEDAEDAEGLSPLETRFVTLISSGASMAVAARALGKSVRTLRRWKQRPEIAAAIRERTSEHMAQAHAVLASAAIRAARELNRLCTSAKPDAARIVACREVLANATKLDEEDVEARFAEIEARLNRRVGP
jgi:hypothetical protein